MIKIECIKTKGPNGEDGTDLKIQCEGTGADLALEAASILFQLPMQLSEKDIRLNEALAHNFRMMVEGFSEAVNKEREVTNGRIN